MNAQQLSKQLDYFFIVLNSFEIMRNYSEHNFQRWVSEERISRN